jgi:hypothetical protein
MNKEKFNKIIDEGIARNRNFMAVKIETEGNPGYEIIINPSVNFKAKIRYYDKNYNDNMELIKAKEAGKIIRIIDVIMTSNLNDLSWFAY